MNFNKLVQTLQEVGKATELFTSPDGSRVLVLPHGARIVGLFTPRNDENFFWNHAALERPETARELYESAWHNSGGNRTWLAPEVDVFFPEYPNVDLAGYRIPGKFDPGNYRVVKTADSVGLASRFTLHFYRTKQEAELEFTKAVSSAPNPLRHERDLRGLDYEYGGLTQITTLALVGDSANRPVQVGIWDLLQLPHGGDLFVTTYTRVEPKIFIGRIASDNLIITDHAVRYRTRTVGHEKIGVRAVVGTGRVGYCYPAGDQLALVIRNYFINPSGEYVDVPWTELEDLGYSMHACGVSIPSGQFKGEFTELEYHAPGIGAGTGCKSHADTSQLWAFRGSRQVIDTIAKRLLGPECGVEQVGR
ncbi:MAG: hypothetical protein HY508_00340 [Acidobacteria bacterium]|nr:hypothetical protein [Acidobacteriota bacterium]